jgi:alpha,alpha-trehalase
MIRAVILDLDGVITDTAQLHTRAWKKIFDSFLFEYSKNKGIPFLPMDQDSDYRKYIDGRPRYDGARAFLESRNINIPFGSPEDTASALTVCGLGNLKNQIYISLLHEHGPAVYDDTINAIIKWRLENKKIAVISASKNCRQVLAIAQITDLFDEITDGNDSVEYNLKGKPAPDIFLFASEKLGIEPHNAIIIEDSSAGVKAGKDGGFEFTIGISRTGTTGLLFQNGADMVVSSLLDIPNLNNLKKTTITHIPSAIEHFEIISSNIYNKNLLLLLDYDGTLAPIASSPKLALLSDTMLEAIRLLTHFAKVAIISGRDLGDIKTMINLDSIYYSGSHGFVIEGPNISRMEPESAIPFLPFIDKAEIIIKNKLSAVPGILIERKRFMIAVHYRNTEDKYILSIIELLQSITNNIKELIISRGKKIFEIRPALNWHKGMAVRWLEERLYGKDEQYYPIYIGDDLTDENAFKAVKGKGSSILVGYHDAMSYADFHIDNTDQVLLFLKMVYKLLSRPESDI